MKMGWAFTAKNGFMKFFQGGIQLFSLIKKDVNELLLNIKYKLLN